MPNKTHEKPAKKTASAPRRNHKIVLIFALVAVWYLVLGFGVNKFADQLSQIEYWKLEIADTPAERTRGLGGRDSLPENQGMLFVFDEPGEYCFWMKDTRFPLDIIWLDNEKRVTEIAHNVRPESFPEQFCPENQASYVIEVNAGVAKQDDVNPGDQLQF